MFVIALSPDGRFLMCFQDTVVSECFAKAGTEMIHVITTGLVKYKDCLVRSVPF